MYSMARLGLMELIMARMALCWLFIIARPELAERAYSSARMRNAAAHRRLERKNAVLHGLDKRSAAFTISPKLSMASLSFIASPFCANAHWIFCCFTE